MIETKEVKAPIASHIEQILSMPPLFAYKIETLIVAVGYIRIYRMPYTVPLRGVYIDVPALNETSSFIYYDKRRSQLVISPREGIQAKEYVLDVVLRNIYSDLTSHYAIHVSVVNGSS